MNKWITPLFGLTCGLYLSAPTQDTLAAGLSVCETLKTFPMVACNQSLMEMTQEVRASYKPVKVKTSSSGGSAGGGYVNNAGNAEQWEYTGSDEADYEYTGGLGGSLPGGPDGDIDNDGIPDPIDNDIDNDGVQNSMDPDDDNDGWSDQYEIMVTMTTPSDPDSDNDGVIDLSDNFPLDSTQFRILLSEDEASEMLPLNAGKVSIPNNPQRDQRGNASYTGAIKIVNSHDSTISEKENSPLR